MSNEPSRAYITTKILQRRYGRLLKWRKPVIHNIRGPYHPDVFDGFAFDLETTSLRPVDAQIVGISISMTEGKGYYMPLNTYLS